MIGSEEIQKISKEKAINTSNIQRDYLFGWLLFYIFTQSKYKDILFLKGGNALRKGYFVNTRFSSDLDFGTPHDLDIDDLRTSIEDACNFIQTQSKIKFAFERNSVDEKFGKWKETRWKVFEAKIYFNDFYGKADHIVLKISLDITRFDKTYLPIQTVPLIHPYSDSKDLACDIRCMQLEEVLATKLKCLLQREHSADLYDFIYSIYLNPDVPIDKGEIRRVFLKRTIFERNVLVIKNILLNLPLEYMKATWAKNLVCTKDVFIEIDDAITRFSEEIQEIFKDAQDNPWTDKHYFNSEFRNTILRAGKEMKLLRMTYQGVPRLVESYALKFQERSDGVAKEYLYVYDRTGSKNNPGWKTFVAENTSDIEMTDEKFEPQYEIELCKAGEYPDDKYLYDVKKKQQKEYEKSVKASKRATRSPSRVRSVFSGPKHVFKCSTCGKKFYRKEYNATLKQHKNKQKYPCYGYGIYDGMKY